MTIRYGKWKSGTANRLSLEVEQMKLLLEYEGQEHDRAAMEERDRIIANLLLGKMMVDPPFSYKGEGEGTPIEDTFVYHDRVALLTPITAVNSSNRKTRFIQVTVRRRGIPADIFRDCSGESFEWYPVGGKAKEVYVDMSEDELAAAEGKELRHRRQVLGAGENDFRSETAFVYAGDGGCVGGGG